MCIHDPYTPISIIKNIHKIHQFFYLKIWWRNLNNLNGECLERCLEQPGTRIVKIGKFDSLINFLINLIDDTCLPYRRDYSLSKVMKNYKKNIIKGSEDLLSIEVRVSIVNPFLSILVKELGL